MTSHHKIIRFLAKTNLILYPSLENTTTHITIGPSNQHDVVGNGLASWALILRTSHLSNEKEEKTRRHQRLHHRSVDRWVFYNMKNQFWAAGPVLKKKSLGPIMSNF